MSLTEGDLEAVRQIFREELREALKGAPRKEKHEQPPPKADLVGKYATVDDMVRALAPEFVQREPKPLPRQGLWRRAAWDHGFPERDVFRAVARLVPLEPLPLSATSLGRSASPTFGKATEASKEKAREATDEEREAALGLDSPSSRTERPDATTRKG